MGTDDRLRRVSEETLPRFLLFEWLVIIELVRQQVGVEEDPHPSPPLPASS